MFAKRALLVAATVVAAGLTLAGCSQSTSPGTSPTEGSGNAQAKNITVAFVPKLQGIPYFQAMNTGGMKAAQDLGFTWEYPLHYFFKRARGNRALFTSSEDGFQMLADQIGLKSHASGISGE